VIEKLVAQVTKSNLVETISTLESFFTRQSQSTTAVLASTYLLQTFTNLGLNASLHHFRDGYSSNVIADIPGKVSPQKYVVVGAHYDCRNTNVSSNNTRAPGANDDASGISALVELARIFKSAPISIPYTIRFAAFSGEEQGLYGSTALANEYKAAGVDVVAMVQADTIGYQSTDYLGLNFGARYTTDAFTLLLEQLANQYVPALTIGRDQGCCSDQQPFFQQWVYCGSIQTSWRRCD